MLKLPVSPLGRALISDNVLTSLQRSDFQKQPNDLTS